MIMLLHRNIISMTIIVMVATQKEVFSLLMMMSLHGNTIFFMNIMLMIATHKEVSDLRFLNASAAMERISLLLKSLKHGY